jgi:hypothetical protein
MLVIPGVVALGEWLTVPLQLGRPIAGGVIGYYASLVILLILYYLRPMMASKKKCPKCNDLLPKVLPLPPNLNRFVYGGWICQNCGCEVDRNGRRLI